MKTGPEDQKKVLQAAADLGRANGIEACAKIIAELANHRGRVVGTNDLRAVAADLRLRADALRSEAKDTLNFYSIILNS